jgi:hypothetical protein
MEPPSGGFFVMEPAMATMRLNVSVRLRWWVLPYMAVLSGLSRLTGMKPCMAKIEKVLRSGVVVEIGEAKAHGAARQEGA